MPLEIYRRNAVWYCRGTIGPAGRRKNIRCSLRTKNKDIAARQAAAIEKNYWDGHFDGPEAVLTFAHAVRLYRGAGKADDKKYSAMLDKVERYLGPTLVRDITEGAIHQMALDLYPDATGASRNRLVITTVQAVINHAAKSKLCQRIAVERFKIETKVKEPATIEWVRAFMGAAGPHVGAFAMFCYLTGARANEAISVRWDDVDLQAGRVLIRESKVAKERVSHLPPALVAVLANLPRIEGRGVFGYSLANDLRNAWEAAIERAGITRLTPHCMRHGFATGLLRRGVDVVTVAWLGGWKSPAQVLKTYGHANKNPKLVELLLDTRELEPAMPLAVATYAW